jgi:2'-5' RNA ligase
VAQSVELLLDDDAEAAIRAQWDRLAAAGLPSERRAAPSEHHRPHLTLYAAEDIPEAAEEPLPALVAGVDLELQLGSLSIFGPRHGRFILVRQAAASVPLLELQARVASACGADPTGQFGPGRWTPHITLARRVPTERAGDVLTALGSTADRPRLARITRCRRWDGRLKRAWPL